MFCMKKRVLGLNGCVDNYFKSRRFPIAVIYKQCYTIHNLVIMPQKEVQQTAETREYTSLEIPGNKMDITREDIR